MLVHPSWLLLLAAGCGAIPAQSPASAPPDTVRVFVIMHGVCVFADTVVVNPRTGEPLLAMARTEPRVPCPVIVYNPLTINQLPGPVAIFILIHEYAHLLHQHIYPSGLPPDDALALVQAAEREADCTAAVLMAAKWPDLLPAVVAFYALSGQPDEEHDDGPLVAERIIRCARGGNP